MMADKPPPRLPGHVCMDSFASPIFSRSNSIHTALLLRHVRAFKCCQSSATTQSRSADRIRQPIASRFIDAILPNSATELARTVRFKCRGFSTNRRKLGSLADICEGGFGRRLKTCGHASLPKAPPLRETGNQMERLELLQIVGSGSRIQSKALAGITTGSGEQNGDAKAWQL